MKIIVLFKTHLDIGFTDFSENVVKKYNDNTAHWQKPDQPLICKKQRFAERESIMKCCAKNATYNADQD